MAPPAGWHVHCTPHAFHQSVADVTGKYDIIRYYKKPSYCARSYPAPEGRRAEGRPTDARSKARQLQRISLRHRK
ncbi:calcium/calmodulin-dependent 3',5'-cyclic nucleotide phosphodiesterase 1C-like isoform X1 [Arapaima gigas]